MATTESCLEIPEGGFSFDNCARNALLEKMGHVAPRFRKTGTTIVGLIFEDGVILGADTRATEDTTVADKNCEKIHYIAPNIYCCGAGTAADTEMTTNMISSNLELHRYTTGRPSRVCTANRMLKQYLYGYQGHISAALVLGGVDCNGPHLYSIHPHGSTDKLPYVTMGSGSLAAMSVFESRYKPNMKKADAMLLVKHAVEAGIFNDLGSGSNVDLCIIDKKQKVEYLRTYFEANLKGKRQGDYSFNPGTTAVLSSKVKKISFDVVSEEVQEVEGMEVS